MSVAAHACKSRDAGVADRELRYLIDVSLLPGAILQPTTAAVPPGLDWQRFLRLAERHRVVGLIAARLIAAQSPMPAEVREALEQSRAAQTMQFLAQTAETMQVVESLTALGATPVILKGSPLAMSLYADCPESRQSIDVDVLVDASDAERAEEVLQHAGYRRLTPQPDLPPATRSMARYLLNAFEYVHAATGSKVELHHRLLLDPILMQRSHRDLLDAAEVVTLGGNDVRVLGDADLTLYLCCHGASHRFFRLKWLADLARIFDRSNGGAVAQVLARAREAGCYQHIAVSLALLERVSERRFAALSDTDRHAVVPLVQSCLDAISAEERGTEGFHLADVPADLAEMVYGLRLTDSSKSRGFKLLQHLSNHQDLAVIGRGVEWCWVYALLGRPLALWRWLSRWIGR